MKKINVDVTPVFRQVVLKLANTYEPKFEIRPHHKTGDDLINNFVDELVKDFSNQIKGPLTEEITKLVHEQL